MTSKLEKGKMPEPKNIYLCHFCGREYVPNPTDYKRGRGRFCSMGCWFDYRREQDVIKGRRLNLECLNCSSPFTTTKKETEKGGGRFCSSKCATEYHVNQGTRKIAKLKKTCQECGKEYETYPSKPHRKFCSRSCAAVSTYRSNGQVNKGTQRGRGGIKPDLGIYVRSSWEGNYARYLNHLLEKNEILKWEYEPDTFEFVAIKRGVRFYTPDFKVFLPDGKIEYHEVKGWFDAKSKTRAKRMAKYFPNVEIKLIDQRAYRELTRLYKDSIENWEV